MLQMFYFCRNVKTNSNSKEESCWETLQAHHTFRGQPKNGKVS